MFKKIGIALLAAASLGFMFDWALTQHFLIFGLGMLAIGVVVNARSS